MVDFFSWPVRVHYEDTDASGVAYRARYLHWFERAQRMVACAGGRIIIDWLASWPAQMLSYSGADQVIMSTCCAPLSSIDIE